MKKNFIYQSAYQLTTMLLPIVTVPIVTRAFGATGVGEWNYIFSSVSYFILIAGLGLANYATREISIVSTNPNKLTEKFWEIELFNCLIVAVSVLCYFLLVAFLFPYKSYFYIMSISLIGSFFDVSWFFLGISDFKKIAIINILIKLFSLIGIVLLIHDRGDFHFYVWIQSVTVFISQFTFFLFLKPHISFFLPNKKKVFQHFKPALSYFVSKVGANLFMNVNKTILGVFSAMQLLGIYSNALIFVSMSGGVLNSLNVVMIPHMSKLVHGEKNNQKSNQLFSDSLHFQLYLAFAMMFGVITINDNLILWFFGSGFELMKKVVPVMALSIILQAFYNTVSTQNLIPHGKMRFNNTSLITGLIVTVSLSLMTVPIFGLFGAVYAYLIGQLVVCIIRYFYLKKYAAFSFNWKLIFIFLFSGISMLGLTKIFSTFFAAGAAKTFVQILLGAGIYLSLTYKIYLKKFL